ncbi:MAG: prepilin-type N-terminal cleavage/methylation domain-containing protein [Chloroflexi bacterium]|nr:prepilin-type N-terminal cleavage/methylation domain-containing protein [Chloroflexota bacterium]
MKNSAWSRRGFTLIEVLIVLAVLGLLAAVVVPNVLGFVTRGGARALESDKSAISLAVNAFKADSHAGISTGQWGKGTMGNWYPTSTGSNTAVELSTTTFDPAYPSNPRVMKYKKGPGDNGDALDADITSSVVWMGLLKQEPFGTAGAMYSENAFSGAAHPMDEEQGQYLSDLPDSAAEANTDTDGTPTNGNGLTSGSYVWIVLDTGDVSPAYKADDGKWYAGSNGSYP